MLNHLKISTNCSRRQDASAQVVSSNVNCLYFVSKQTLKYHHFRSTSTVISTNLSYRDQSCSKDNIYSWKDRQIKFRSQLPANMPRLKLLLKSVGPFNFVFLLLETDTRGGNGIKDTISANIAVLTAAKVPCEDVTDSQSISSDLGAAPGHDRPDNSGIQTVGITP